MVSQEQFELVATWWTTPWPTAHKLDAAAPGAGSTDRGSAPTVLTGVTHEMRIMREEIFGPVVPIVTVDSEEEAIRLANDSEFGLGASVWTLNDRAKGERIARRIESGMVWINDHMYTHGAMQCGGRREALGRSAHTRSSLYECVDVVTGGVGAVIYEFELCGHPYEESPGGESTPPRSAVSTTATTTRARRGEARRGRCAKWRESLRDGLKR